MTPEGSPQPDSQTSSVHEVDPAVLSGEACVKCGFKCIEGCV